MQSQYKFLDQYFDHQLWQNNFWWFRSPNYEKNIGYLYPPDCQGDPPPVLNNKESNELSILKVPYKKCLQKKQFQILEYSSYKVNK